MTHAFFKALLFMAAGSLIGAMAGSQSLDRMGGFRKAMPFTFIGFVVGGLALVRAAAVLRLAVQGRHPRLPRPPRRRLPRARDPRLHRRVPDRALHVPDDLPCLLRRAGGGGARARSTATSRTPTSPATPPTGEEEDTDVGFPGPEHHIAERDPPMKVAMGALAVLAVIGGVLQIPGVDAGIDAVPLADFRRLACSPARPRRPGADWVGLVIGARDRGRRASRLAYRLWIAAPETPRHAARALQAARTRCSSTSGTSTS